MDSPSEAVQLYGLMFELTTEQNIAMGDILELPYSDFVVFTNLARRKNEQLAK